MKLEPIRQAKLPKYAAALAALTAAVGMLTACDSREVQLDGTAPDPSVTAVQDPADRPDRFSDLLHFTAKTFYIELILFA